MFIALEYVCIPVIPIKKPPKNTPPVKHNTNSNFHLSNQFSCVESLPLFAPIPFIIIEAKIINIVIDTGIIAGVYSFVISVSPYDIFHT